MATYKSKYTELTFYVDGVPRSFKGGHYVTDDKKEIEVLDKITDAIKDEIVAPKETVKTETKAEAKPAPRKGTASKK